MKDKRQGNDLKVAWSIFMQDGEPFRLDGKDVSLYLKNMFGRKELNDFVVTGNIIQWTFYGKDQKNSGKYSLELVINEGEKGMITTDKCDFVNLVSCSCKLQGGEDAPNVETESIELTSTLEYVSGGGDYDDTALWKELENKVDKEKGKGLSSNDFTNALKEKLEGLENYDDAEISSAVEKLSRDFETLLGNNASAAIESFNEIIAFLEGIEDSASLDAIVASIQQEIAKVSNGLADTDAKLTELSTKVENINPTQMVSVTYAELVALRDNGELIAGMQYRITDYVTTTAQENTKSAGHQFDVIVTADNKNTLNEVARACLHEEDTYFSEADANLAAWQIWYSLDNDTERFAWADAENGKGVIYRMIDEFENDIPYDFKNIQFVRILRFDNGFAEFSEGGISTWVYTFCANSYHINNDEWSELKDGSLESPYGHMSDENTSTFHHNSMKPRIMYYNGNDVYQECGKAYLNDNVFLGYWEEIGSANEEDMPYYYAYCSYGNSFGEGCYSNSFGEGCNSNSFGNYCNSNSFGNNCNSNSFGEGCYSNSFGNNCYSNSFGNYCYSNSFGNYCNSNSFGNNCYSNSFGNSSQSNELKAYYCYITFGEGVQYVTLLNETEGYYENQVQNYRVANGTHGEDGNPLIVDVTRNMGCETFIGMDSNDELKVFCLADLLNL